MKEKEHNFAMESLPSYVLGFMLSILLTVVSFVIVMQHLFSTPTMIATILTLAVLQVVVQLVFFLHLGKGGTNARWNLIILFSTISIILLVVIGSLWIMGHLDYNMSKPDKINEFILHDEGMEH